MKRGFFVSSCLLFVFWAFSTGFQNESKTLRLSSSKLASSDIPSLLRLAGQTNCTDCKVKSFSMQCTIKGNLVNRNCVGNTFDKQAKQLIMQMKQGEKVIISNVKAFNGSSQIMVVGLSVVIL